MKLVMPLLPIEADLVLDWNCPKGTYLPLVTQVPR